MDFDLNPESFTLENMFAMELHRFHDIIADITASAAKELSIEKGINEVADTWGNMKFSVPKYMKGTQDRGMYNKLGSSRLVTSLKNLNF